MFWKLLEKLKIASLKYKLEPIVLLKKKLYSKTPAQFLLPEKIYDVTKEIHHIKINVVFVDILFYVISQIVEQIDDSATLILFFNHDIFLGVLMFVNKDNIKLQQNN